MLTLILDTSTDFSILALARDDQLLAEYPLPVGRQSQVILPSIVGFLACHQLSLKNLDAIALGTGPGAFTGTRIGLSIGKTLGYALNIPMLPFCSLKALPQKPGALCLFDAKGGYLYAYDGKKTALMLIQDLLKTQATLISPHVPEIQKHLMQPAPHLKWRSAQPSASQVACFLPTLDKVAPQKVQATYLRAAP